MFEFAEKKETAWREKPPGWQHRVWWCTCRTQLSKKPGPLGEYRESAWDHRDRYLE
jgi:hypothetical protein